MTAREGGEDRPPGRPWWPASSGSAGSWGTTPWSWNGSPVPTPWPWRKGDGPRRPPPRWTGRLPGHVPLPAPPPPRRVRGGCLPALPCNGSRSPPGCGAPLPTVQPRRTPGALPGLHPVPPRPGPDPGGLLRRESGRPGHGGGRGPGGQRGRHRSPLRGCRGEAPGSPPGLGGPFPGGVGLHLQRDQVSPPGNRNPRTDEIEACSPYLRAQIRAVQPEAILAVGTFAGQLL
jgi:uracil-DNA glycosylase